MELRSGQNKQPPNGKKALIGTPRKRNLKRKPRRRNRGRGRGRTIRKGSKASQIISKNIVYKSKELQPAAVSAHGMDLRISRTAVKQLRRVAYFQSPHGIVRLRNARDRAHAQHRRPLSRGWLSTSNLASPGTWPVPGHLKLASNNGLQSLPPLPEHTRRMLKGLNLPYYDTPVDQTDPDPNPELSISLLSTRLGWTISTAEPVPFPSVLKEERLGIQGWRTFLSAQSLVEDSGEYPAKHLLPSVYPDTDINGAVEHQRDRFEFAGLVLPVEWEPLHQGPIYYIEGGTSDSVGAAIEDSHRKAALLPPSDDGHQPPSLQTPRIQTVSVTASTILRPRIRSQWEAIHAMQLGFMSWRLESSSIISQRDIKRRVGNVDQNQTSMNKDIWPQSSFPIYLAYNFPSHHSHSSDESAYGGTSDSSTLSSSESEKLPRFCISTDMSHRDSLGRAIANIVSCDMLPISRNRLISLPRAAQCSTDEFTLSLACKVPPNQLQWEHDHLPLLFAAQYCPTGEESRAKAHIAYALHQTLLVLVLYYLDTRCRLSDLLPEWMVVFGITYHERSYTVHAHFPVFHFSREDTDERTPRHFGWAFYSNPVITFDVSFDSRKTIRAEIVALLRIQSQARYLLRKLQEWTGYAHTLKLLHGNRTFT